ncbi:hypothetical protein [Azospirillum picis]|uniref:Uncharacterized protein n=1 Tax=Azospirillum picis TaxID=488438 RepID=A0ABU0MJP7_9PROT|nr:hypothetical protein [Azospirillum picis]MBP2299712.1 hypothetical protein [Azospirillum picis]MDQ0533508.1 hypothetical protein [Azospirillum picis]
MTVDCMGCYDPPRTSGSIGLRYYIIEDEDGWQVVDGWTHLVAVAAGLSLHGLSFHKADDLAELLNREAQCKPAVPHLQPRACHLALPAAAPGTESPSTL